MEACRTLHKLQYHKKTDSNASDRIKCVVLDTYFHSFFIVEWRGIFDSLLTYAHTTLCRLTGHVSFWLDMSMIV